MSCERHGKGTRSPAGARAAGSDLRRQRRTWRGPGRQGARTDAAGGLKGRGGKAGLACRRARSQGEGDRGRGGRWRRWRRQRRRWRRRWRRQWRWWWPWWRWSGSGAIGAEDRHEVHALLRLDRRLLRLDLWPSRTSFVWTSLLFFSHCFFLNTKSISRISYVKGPRRCKPPTRTPISQILIEVVNLISEPLPRRVRFAQHVRHVSTCPRRFHFILSFIILI